MDELTSEQEILREEIKSLHAVNGRLKQKIQGMEEDLKKAKEDATKQSKTNKSDDEVIHIFIIRSVGNQFIL